MGNFTSKPRGISREQLLKSTENSRDFTNKLFNVMITKLTPEDFLKLSKSQSCSSFVFLMADSISKLFDNLQIHPKRDKQSGIVFFQKVDTLKTQTPESRELCTIIAFFYVRIFQIFGALAMSIVDDPSAGATLGIMKYRPQELPQGQEYGLFGQQGRYLPKQPLPRPHGAMLGGANPKYFMSSPVLRKFISIKDLLEEPELINIPGETDKQGFQFVGSQICLIPSRSDSRNIYMPVEAGHLLCAMTLTEPARRADATVQMIITLNNFKYIDTSIDSTILASVNNALKNPKFIVTFKVISIDNKQTWYKEGETLTETIEDQLQKIIRRAVDYIKDPTKLVAPAVAGVAGRPLPQTNIGVHSALVNEYIIRTLKGIAGYKTTSLCVARALQLIDANSLFSPKPTQISSGICSTKFDSLPISVPESKKGITSVPGLKALDQLYYGNPHIDSSDKLKFDADITYADFLQQMSGLFGGAGAGAGAKLTSLDSVIAKDPNCPATAVKHYLRIEDPARIQKILGIVRQLFGKQFSHTEKVLKFFKNTLFSIKKTRDPISGAVGSYIEIHPKLMRGGIDYISIVSKQAREILVEYYKGCEETYQLGVQEVLNSKYTVV